MLGRKNTRPATLGGHLAAETRRVKRSGLLGKGNKKKIIFLTLLPAVKTTLKPFELLTYKFVTFPKYEFKMFSQKFCSIYFFKTPPDVAGNRVNGSAIKALPPPTSSLMVVGFFFMASLKKTLNNIMIREKKGGGVGQVL